MKGKLFIAVVLVVILTLVLVVPASAKPWRPVPFLGEVRWTAMPATGGTYIPSHSVDLEGYKGYFLRYEITWYNADNALGVMGTQVAIKTAMEQTVVIPSSGFKFTVGSCGDTNHPSTETITIVDRKGTIQDSQSRYFDCRLNLDLT